MPPIALLAQVLRVDRALGSAALASSDAVKKLGFYKGELETWAETVERGGSGRGWTSTASESCSGSRTPSCASPPRGTTAGA